MEIYLQEVLVATYVKRLPDDSQCLIQKFASGFPLVLQTAVGFLDAGIPHHAKCAIISSNTGRRRAWVKWGLKWSFGKVDPFVIPCKKDIFCCSEKE